MVLRNSNEAQVALTLSLRHAAAISAN